MASVSKHILTVILFIFSMPVSSQNILIPKKQILSFEEFLGYVKQQHPLIKQAELTLSIGEANVLKAKGGFDPKIELNYNGKRFKDIEYYDELNTTFKIPTWYGIEFKANFEQNSGEFLNPRLDVPDEGLYSVGVSVSLAQGFLINERMATLRKAKFFREQTKADRDLLVNKLLFEASKAYFEWLRENNEKNIYSNFLDNASVRLKAIERSVEVGEKPKIDITEARIILQNRKLNLEAAILRATKAALIVSNYLWLDGIPVELQTGIIPYRPETRILQQSLQIEGITNTDIFLEGHPKLQSIDAKISSLTVDKSLKQNKLLPKIDVNYNFISSDVGNFSSYNNQEYKAGLKVSYPIFTRKERGDLRLAKQKLQDANYERASTALNLKNKISAVNAEINSLLIQNELINNIIIDYETLVKAEERKFFLGESSLFLINSREQKLIDTQLKQNKLVAKQLKATANLYNALGIR